jgi:archaeal type IV pilus assembly protein PilA
MKNLKQSKKALSPVIASIILIAVTVAVSIAVAAWMGALVVGQMKTEELKITGVQFTTVDSAKVMVVSVRNQGTSGLTISAASVNGGASTDVNKLIAANGQDTVTIPCAWAIGGNYQVILFTAQGNQFMYSAVA